MEWGILASIVAVISPLFLVIVTYVKTWSKFEVTVNNLSKCVDKLTRLVEALQKNHAELAQDVIRLDTRITALEKEVDIWNARFDNRGKD